MQVMLMIHEDEARTAALAADALGRRKGEHMAFAKAMQEAGVLRGAGHLHGSAEAVSARPAADGPAVQEGPHAAGTGQLAGFFLLEVADMREARDWALRCPSAREAGSGIELREVWPTPTRF